MRFYRVGAVVAAAAIASTIALSGASAMTTTTPPDNGQHPGVVALLLTRVRGDVTQATMYCSGMLIAPRVVLTASHCNDIVNEDWFKTGGYGLAVTNDQELPGLLPNSGWFVYSDLEAKSLVQLKNVKLNPDYRKGYREDVSAQVLDGDLGVDKADFGVLPEKAGLLDEMKASGALRGASTLVLGYGSSQKVVPANVDVAFPDTNERRLATLPLVALTPQWLKQSQSIAKGQDGACYGDSGGPSILPAAEGDPLVVVGVTSTGDGPCFATNVASRTDTQPALDFMRGVLAEAASR